MRGRQIGSGKPRQRKDKVWEVMVLIRNEIGESKRIPIYGETYEECEKNKNKFLSEILPNLPKEDKVNKKVEQAISFIKKAPTQQVTLKDNVRYAKRPHIMGENGFTLCGCNTDYVGANVFWGKEYRGSASKCTCKKCMGIFINKQSEIANDLYENAEVTKVSIERSPINDRPRFEKLKETADLLEAGYDEFVSNLKKPEIQALSVLTKVNISPSDEYLEILKGLPQAIRNLAEELEKSDKLAVYENWANDSLRYLKAAGKI
jgi:hypothetical protein